MKMQLMKSLTHIKRHQLQEHKRKPQNRWEKMDLRSRSQLPLEPPPVETLKDSDKGPSKGNQHHEHKHHNPPKRNEVEIRSARINV
jgi:hypothetical protein